MYIYKTMMNNNSKGFSSFIFCLNLKIVLVHHSFDVIEVVVTLQKR